MNWIIHWLFNYLSYPVIVWLAIWLIFFQAVPCIVGDWLNDWLFDRLIDCFDDWFPYWLIAMFRKGQQDAWLHEWAELHMLQRSWKWIRTLKNKRQTSILPLFSTVKIVQTAWIVFVKFKMSIKYVLFILGISVTPGTDMSTFDEKFEFCDIEVVQ